MVMAVTSSIAVVVLTVSCAALGGAVETKAAYVPLVMKSDDIARLKWNVANLDWAQAQFLRIRAEVDAWRGKKLDIPDKGGGWGQDYVSPDNGRKLSYDRSSPDRHLEPISGKYYEGDKLDASWRGMTHMQNIGLANKAALLYRLTDDAWYAEFARDVLARYAGAYASYPPMKGPAGLGRINAQALDEAVWLIQACSAFDLLASAQFLGESDKTIIVNQLFMPAVRQIQMYPFGIHNIQVWESTAILMAGLIGNKQKIVREAVKTLEENIDRGIREEGFWFETSVPYHFYVSRPFETMAVVCRNRGLEVRGMAKLRRLFTAMAGLVEPDGSLPALNDGARGGVLTGSLSSLVTARYAFDDASLDPLIAKLFADAGGKMSELTVFLYYIHPKAAVESWRPPEKPTHMPDAGITVLRRAGRWALLKYNSYNGGHDHFDRLGMIFNDGGRELYPDLGTINYGHPLYKAWYKTTEAHNTIMVDGKQQAKEGCAAPVFKDERDFAGVSVRCDMLYEGVSVTRALALTDTALVDVVLVRSGSDHTYDWFLHVGAAAEKAAQMIPDASPNPEIDLDSSGPFSGPKTIPLPPAKDGGKDMLLTLFGSEGDVLYQGTATGVFPDEKMPLLMWRKKGKTAVFVAVTAEKDGPRPAAAADGDMVTVSVGEVKIKIDLRD